jgi:alpha-glucosidase
MKLLKKNGIRAQRRSKSCKIKTEWWQEAVIYQIYPRSFKDTNGDGVGDLAGIREKVGYLSELGVDAVWLSPINTSPMLDFGYDISDYRGIDPLFGSMADFDELLAELHGKNIKLLLDLVVNHTSSLHPWFVEARSSRDNAKRDWYIWREGDKNKFPHAASDRLRAGGKVSGLVPPNNWQSVFGGPAWTWDDTTGAWYLHSFLAEQPDLNWRNPEVKEAVFADIEFWLKKGVDGFRLDVVNLYFKDSQFRDNPLRLWGWRYPRPYEFQQHVHDMSQPEMHPLLKDLRQLLDTRTMPLRWARCWSISPVTPSLRRAILVDERRVAHDVRLHAAVPEMECGRHGEGVAQLVRRLRRPLADTGASTTTTRIDRTRAMREGSESDARAKVLAALLLTARGTPYLYYGDEIGMKNGKVARHELRDPVGIRFWPLTVSRDPARTPMLWDATAGAGFTTAKPWLPLNDDYVTVATWRRSRPTPTRSGTGTANYAGAHARRTPALQAGRIGTKSTAARTCWRFAARYERESIEVFLNFSNFR